MRNDLTADQVRSVLDYNPETGVFVWKKKTSRSSRITIGAIAGHTDKRDGYNRICVFGRIYKSHRLAWLYFYGEWPTRHIDHANCIKDDNRISNLRMATRSQNISNSKIRKDNSSGFKGVYLRHGRWNAQIRHNTKIINLGNFPSPEEAHEAYCDAANKLRGEFARHS